MLLATEPPDLLHYLSECRVIICLSCQYALQPTGISRHLKDIHHILRSHKKAFLDYVSAFDLADAEDVMRSTDTLKKFPIPLLPVVDGLRCSHDGCSHLCVTEKRMKSHWILTHEKAGRPGIDWGAAPLQTLFRGNSLKYFTDPLITSASPPALARYQSDTVYLGDDESALLNHYITSTSPTLAHGIRELPSNLDSSLRLQDAELSVWQEAIPQLARNYQFLMHEVLACAAMHLAYLDPSRRQSYVIKAAEYQDLAMGPFREAIANLDGINCNAVFAFIHILAILSFSLHKANEHLLIASTNDSDPISDWLSLMRAGCEYVHSVRAFVETGPLKAFLCERNLEFYMKIGDVSELPLVQQLLKAIPSKDSEEAWSIKESKTYSDAVHDLGRSFIFAEHLGDSYNTWDALRSWPMMLSLDFFRLVQSQHPGALIALAHFSRLLHKLDDKWYFQGRAGKLLDCILAKLDTKWHIYADWSTRT